MISYLIIQSYLTEQLTYKGRKVLMRSSVKCMSPDDEDAGGLTMSVRSTAAVAEAEPYIDYMDLMQI